MLVDRFQVVVSRGAVTSPPNQDVMTMSVHFARRTTVEGSTATALDNTIRALVESRWDTFWTTAKSLVQSWAVLSELRWYDGWPTEDPPVPPRRVTARSVAGTGSSVNGVPPPQACINCTLATVSRRHWARFSLGGLGNVTDGQGLLTSANRSALATALAAFLNGCLTDGAAPVSYRRPRFSYDSSHHRVSLLEAPTYRPIVSCRIDDVLDIQRRRRWEHTTNRTINDLTVPMAALAQYTGPLNDVQG